MRYMTAFGCAAMLAAAAGISGCGGGGAPSPAAPNTHPDSHTSTTAEPAATAAPASDGSPVATVSLRKDNGNGEAGDVVAFFEPGNRHHFFEANTSSNVPTGTKVKWIFTGESTAAGNGVKVAEFVIEVGKLQLIANQLTANVKLPNDWPYGNYKAEIFFDDKLVKTVKYAVAPPEGTLVALSQGLYHDDGKGGQGEKVAAFKATNHNLHFAVIVAGHLPSNAAARWTFTAVDTAQGKNVKLGDIDGQLPDFKDSRFNTLFGNVELPKDWPVGTYKADVQVGNKLVTTIEYKVE